MSLPVLIDGVNYIEIRSLMRPGMRISLMLLGLFPMIAPYELLVRVDWQEYLHPFFFLAAFISAGAIALCLLFLYAAIAGISSRLVFDKSTSTLTYSFGAPMVRWTSRVYPISAIDRVETGERDWSDGAPTYHLLVAINDGTVVESGSSWSRGEVESIRARIESFFAGEVATRPTF
jgi:hypothetical protein